MRSRSPQLVLTLGYRGPASRRCYGGSAPPSLLSTSWWTEFLLLFFRLLTVVRRRYTYNLIICSARLSRRPRPLSHPGCSRFLSTDAPWGPALGAQSWSCRPLLYYIGIQWHEQQLRVEVEERVSEQSRKNAAGQHHHRIHFDKCHPGYFVKIGMRNLHVIKKSNVVPTIHVEWF